MPTSILQTINPVIWDENNHPYAPQFDDVYHTTSGALEQANHVFLKGCNLPNAWQKQPVFTLLETGFGLGLNFLATWFQWQQDPKRCKRLHFVSVEAYPVSAADILKAVENIPTLKALGEKLAQQYPAATLPGLHRLEFDEGEHGAVILTLAVGYASKLLPQLQLEADAIYLDGFSPAKNPDLWSKPICAAIAKLSKPQAHISTWCVAGEVRRNLEAVGFNVQKVEGLPPKKEALVGQFMPKNLARRSISTQAGNPSNEQKVGIIGAGFAGASLAWALGKRGWQVDIIDKAAQPAQGASGLPLGLGIPNVSKDDALLTQITRAGAQWLRHVVRSCGLEKKYWHDDPVEQLVESMDEVAIPTPWGSLGKHVFKPTLTNEGQPCRHFHQGMRLEGPAFVQALLNATPHLQTMWNTEIARIEQDAQEHWLLFNPQDTHVASYPHLVVAAAMGSLPLSGLEHKALTPNRGQIDLGRKNFTTPTDFLDARTGHGHFLLPQREDAGWSWSMGSTFDADCTIKDVLASSHAEIFEKLQKLSPKTAKVLEETFQQQALNAFVEIRCTSSDHLPIVGAVPDLKALAQADATRLMNEDCPIHTGLFILSALGSRGLNAGPLCAELLASMMSGEPWPLTKPQAQAMLPARFHLREYRKRVK